MMLTTTRVLITGAAGSIGSELARQLYKKKKRLLLLDNNETGIFNISNELPGSIPIVADIRNVRILNKIFQRHKPNIVFHAAAYKHVPLMEIYPEEAYRTNVLGTINLAQVAISNKVKKFIFISTDKAINPKSIMGKTKQRGEVLCRYFNDKGLTKFIVIRFGNVLDSQGSILPIWRQQIAEGKPITITDKRMKRYFMTIFEACDLVIKAAQLGKGGEIFVFDMGEPLNILELAQQVVRLSGKDVPIKIIGIRPGEKIFEKYYSDNEKLKLTKYKKIYEIKSNGNT